MMCFIIWLKWPFKVKDLFLLLTGLFSLALPYYSQILSYLFSVFLLLLQWEDMRVLGSAFLPGHRSMNPCPVYDEFTGTLFLFFIAVLGHTSESYQLVTGKNVTRLCYVSSTDNGDTWSPVTDLTKKVIGDTIKGQERDKKCKSTFVILFNTWYNGTFYVWYYIWKVLCEYWKSEISFLRSDPISCVHGELTGFVSGS